MTSLSRSAWRGRAIIVAVLLLSSVSASADARDPEAWRAALVDRIVAELAAGRPLVVQVHVPLCDNRIIACGNPHLGDGDDPDANLYWGTTEGTLGWFGRRGGGWRQVFHGDGAAIDAPDVLDVRVWQRTMTTPAAWRQRGAPAHFALDVVAFAWRGTQIDAALARFAQDLSGGPGRALALPDGTQLATGGAAQIVAYVGHNRFMDLDHFAWPTPADAQVRGAIAIACHTAVYLQDTAAGAARVPLLFTRDYLLASSAALEGAVLALARGGGYAAIRRGGAQGYATGGHKSLAHVFGAFTNPSDRRWGTPGYDADINAHARAQAAASAP